MTGQYTERRNPREALAGTWITGNESDHLPVLHGLQADDVRERQDSDEIQEGPGIRTEASALKPAEGIQIQESGRLNVRHRGTP
jgi:hypothetical protein